MQREVVLWTCIIGRCTHCPWLACAKLPACDLMRAIAGGVGLSTLVFMWHALLPCWGSWVSAAAIMNGMP